MTTELQDTVAFITGGVWMLSDRASFMTGHSLVLDGGFLAAGLARIVEKTAASRALPRLTQRH